MLVEKCATSVGGFFSVLVGIWMLCSLGCGQDLTLEQISAAQRKNSSPVVNAGPDQEIVWPAAAVLAGTASDDFLPNPPGSFSSLWTVVSGPGLVSFEEDFNPATRAIFGVAGTYLLRLTATDSALTVFDEMTVTVRSSPVNQPPIVEAAMDTLVNIVTNGFLGGTIRDDGLPNPPGAMTVLWTQISGPADARINDPSSLITPVWFDMSGSYLFRITVSDGELSASDDMVLVADRAAVLDAGPDQIAYAHETVQLAGSATDDGFPDSGKIYASWIVAEGPGPVEFASPSPITTARFRVPGRYVLELVGGDGAILSDPDSMVVTVLHPRCHSNSTSQSDDGGICPE